MHCTTASKIRYRLLRMQQRNVSYMLITTQTLVEFYDAIKKLENEDIVTVNYGEAKK